MHRIETVLGRHLPRIGLSATLGDMQLAASFLRRGKEAEIVDAPSGGSELKVLVKGFEEPAPEAEVEGESPSERAPRALSQHLFAALRGDRKSTRLNSSH